MKNIVVMTLKLLAITIVAGLVLGLVNAITREPIAVQAKKDADAARGAAFPTATTFEPMDIIIGEEYEIIKSVYTALDADGKTLGITAAITTKGFNPRLNLTVGISADGTITGVVIGAHEETPGLGAKASEPKFIDQYKDKPYDSPLVVVKKAPTDTHDIEAITSATITSNGVTDAVNTATIFYKDVIGGAK